MTDEPLSVSGRFRRMADQIDLNDKGSFGGALVIAPPGGIEPIEVLIFDTKEDPARFLMVLKGKLDTLLTEIDEQERRGVTFGRR